MLDREVATLRSGFFNATKGGNPLTMNYWPAVRKTPPVVQREFRGVSKLDPFSMSDAFASDEKNLSASKYPALTIRPGCSTLSGQFGQKVLGLGVWKDAELHAVFDDGTWRKWTGSAWTTLASGLSTTAIWSFTNFKGNLSTISLVGTNGVDPVKVYDGSTVSTLTAPAGLYYIEQYADRLYGAVSNDLKFTAYRMANDWTTANGDDADSGYITIETPTGETITGIKASSSHVTVFKPTSIHELFGTSPSDYRMIRVCTGIGMASNKHAVNIGGILYFIDVTNPGLYVYDGGNLPSKAFSLPVQDYMDRINQSGKMASCVGTDGKNLYVSIPVNGSTPDTTLVYDIQAKAWDVWTDWVPLFFARIGSTNSFYFGDSTGRVKQVTGTLDDLLPISWKRISIPYSAESMAQKLRMTRAWLTATVYAGSTLSVYLSKQDKGDDWTLVKSITANATLESTPIYIPTHVVANAQWIRVKLEGTGPVEIKEFARELQSMPMR